MSRFLVTGGCGFAGSHIVEELCQTDNDVVVMDCLTYAGRLENLLGWDCTLVHHDFSQPIPDTIKPVDYVIHNGAESHVLRSLQDPEKFVRSNVVGTLNLLEWSRKTGVKKFVYVSTDEVFGPSMLRAYTESDVLRPTNPYSATKAGGEFLAHSYFRSFGVPVVITRTVNMFGERQHPEKFVPLVIKKLLDDEVVDIHAEKDEIGSRHWLYAGEQAQGVAWLAEHGEPGRSYHVASGARRTNLAMAELIAKIVGKPLQYQLVRYAWSGHDLHYDIRESSESKNWKSSESFEDQLAKTVNWYLEHQEFLA